MSFQPDLPASQVHAHLLSALEDLRRAERSAVLWFGEVHQRKLYRELGHSSIQQYAELALGFSQSKTYQFLRLCESLRELPELKRSVETGEVSWTKARAITRVATARTEAKWVEAAKTCSRRDLEERIDVAKARARRERKSDPAQATLEVVASPAIVGTGGAVSAQTPSSDDALFEEISVECRLRFSPEQYARLEALLEKARKRGMKGSREEMMLEGLAALVVEAPIKERAPEAGFAEGEEVIGNGAEEPHCTRVQNGNDRSSQKLHDSFSPYQVTVLFCPQCESGEVATSAGPRKLSAASLRAILCDARVQGPDGRNTAAVPPSLRRRVLARDRHTCRIAGCGRTRFISVHHIVPREAGGPNRMENLVSACSSCHSLLHAIENHEVERRKVLQN